MVRQCDCNTESTVIECSLRIAVLNLYESLESKSLLAVLQNKIHSSILCKFYEFVT